MPVSERLPSHLQFLSQEELPLKTEDPLTLYVVVHCEETGFNLQTFLTVTQLGKETGGKELKVSDPSLRVREQQPVGKWELSYTSAKMHQLRMLTIVLGCQALA